MSMTREQRARYYGDQVGREQPPGRRLSPGSHERGEWQKGELRSVLDRQGLSDLYAIAEDALIERVLKQSRKMHSENYRQAYGSSTTRKPSSRRLSGWSNAEYAGHLRSLDRFTEDEIYEKAYRARRDQVKQPNPLSGPRKDARDHAIAQAVETARRAGVDCSVWMDGQGRFHVEPSIKAPWKSTIAVAHAPKGHLSYKSYGGKARRDPSRDFPKADVFYDAMIGYSTHGKGSLRLERGAIGNALWHLPNKSPWVIYWNGPGARLLFGSNKPGSQLSPILHPTADGEYRTLKEATAAVNRFWKAKS